MPHVSFVTSGPSNKLNKLNACLSKFSLDPLSAVVNHRF